MKSLLLASLLAPLAFAPLAPQTPQPIDVTACPNPTPRELLVVYELTGGTLSGPVDLHLSVYSDGSARLASALGDGLGSAQFVHVGSAQAVMLLQGLVAAGAMTHCDIPDFLSDVPLQTLTVLRGTARQRGNTFSWTGGDEQTGAMQDLLQDFIDLHFVPPPRGKSS
jgi:hypothetical protein